MESETICDRLDKRRRAIIDAGRELFIEQGYERTTLHEVVKKSGGSLATIYKLFCSKEGLLEAVVFEKARSGASLIHKIAEEERNPTATLRRLALALRTQFLDPSDIALVRIVTARSIENQAFGQRFFERTAMHTQARLEALFDHWKCEGYEFIGEPQLLAEIFWGMIVSDLHTEAISHGIARKSTEARLARRTEFFLRGAGLT